MAVDIRQILERAVAAGASDVFVVAGMAAALRVNGEIETMDTGRLMPADTARLTAEIYHLAGDRPMAAYEASGDDDFSFALPGVSRFRVSAYRQRGTCAAVIRMIPFTLPDPKALGIPDAIVELGDARDGMMLVTGPAGSGKSTTLACIIDRINTRRSANIITLEDPIEYLHRHKKSIVSQREMAEDSENYVTALRATLRQSPDVILLGEMRDFETISVAMTAAETGHFLLSTLHTVGAANTINRIIDVFPANQQRQVAVQLSMVLNAVVSQQLVPTVDGTVVPVFEMMRVTPAIKNMIRENKIAQIGAAIQSGRESGGLTNDGGLFDLAKAGRITAETAVQYATDAQTMRRLGIA
ncbi:MAG: PilT/PilU family type 4a pilus ATPase [Eubacteriaceae bacterium]|uniref:PilT/PilU family type 4a pilus ATPase n=1 Tax=Candidatus Pseudoramibacter fermentans TaxID=2594427 RepID=A0A6L5GPX5_9FIRM|nr:PilT/PilU family type 4a pilus ATPase [Candidatus Pseudoramibacter fermentans]RRF92449.1 MAG: PilT/PilU family type 4a pilus ATPase [Eubacteriaceae bacterium]